MTVSHYHYEIEDLAHEPFGGWRVHLFEDAHEVSSTVFPATDRAGAESLALAWVVGNLNLGNQAARDAALKTEADAFVAGLFENGV